MSIYSTDDPREIGTSGLSGLNTQEGRRRYTEQMGIPTTIEEYKIASSNQGANYSQPVYNSDLGYYNVDRRINGPNELSNLGDARGRNQRAFSQIANGTVKGVVLAGTTIGNTLGTFLVGIPEAISQGDFSRVYDNEMTRAMQSVNDWSEKQLANFYTDDERQNPLALRNLLSANTLGDKFIKNLGFSVGSAVVGMGAGAAVRGISSIPKIAGMVKTASGAAKSTATLLGAMLSAVGESSFEAKNAADEFRENNLQRLAQEHDMKIQSIREQYADTEMLEPMLMQENRNYQDAVNDVNSRSYSAGDGDFLMNMMILPATNYIQFGKMFARGFKTAEKSTGNLVKDMIKGSVGSYDVNASKLKGLARVAGRGLSEGSEELLQQLATDIQSIHNKKYIDNIYDARLNAEGQEDTISFMKSIGEAVLYTAGQASAWEQFLIGGLTGLTGIPMIRSPHIGNQKRSPIYMAGNAMSEYNDYIRSMNEASDLADRMNKVAAKKDYVELFRGLSADRALQNDMDIAAQAGDAYNYKNAEFLSLANMVDMFTRTGRLNDLKAMVNESFDVNSDEDLENVINLTTATSKAADGTEIKEGPFVENGTLIDITTDEGKEKAKKILSDKKNQMLNTIAMYENASERLDNIPGQNFTDDQRQELIWLQMQLENWRQRGKDMMSELLPHLKTIRNHIDAIRESISTEEDLESNTDYQKALDNANKAISFLDKVVNSSDEASSALLFLDTKLGKRLNFVNNIKNILNNFSDGWGVEKSDIEKDLSSLNDFDKINNVYNRSKTKLDEYLKNPTKIDKAREIIRKKAQKAEKSLKGRNLRSKLNNASDIKAFREAFESAKESPDIKQQILDEVKSTNQIAKDYVDLNDARAQVSNELAAQNISDAQTLGDVSDLFDQAFNNSPNAAYYTDVTAEAYQSTDYLVNKESDPEKIQRRHQAAVSYVSEILGRYNQKRSQAESLGSRVATPEQVEASKPGKTTEPLKENEQGGANPEVKETESKQTTASEVAEPASPVNTDEPLNAEVGEEGSNEELKTIKDEVDSSSSDEARKSSSKDSKPKPYLMGVSAQYNYLIDAITVDKDGNFAINTDAFKPNANFSEMIYHFKEGFDYVNSGKLKIGDTVYIGMEVIQGEKRLVAFIKDGDNFIPLNNISGYNSSSALSRNIGLEALYDKINKEYEDFVSKEENKGKPYISDTTTHVADIMLGKIPFTDKLTALKTVIDNSEKDIYTDKTPIFAIMRSTGLHFGVREKEEIDGISINEETLEPLDRSSNIGRLYITVPNARRGSETGRNAIPVTIKKLDSNWRNQEFFGEKIDSALTTIAQSAIAGNRDGFVNGLKELSKYVNTRNLDIILSENNSGIRLSSFGGGLSLTSSSSFSIRMNKFKRGADGNFVRRQDGRIEYDKQLDSIDVDNSSSIENVKEIIADHLIKLNARYNVDLQQLNDAKYNESIVNSGVLSTYYTSLAPKSAWFVLNYIVNGKEIDAIPPQMTGRKNTRNITNHASLEPAAMPVAKGTNTSRVETVSIKPASFTYNGNSFTIDGDKVIDSSGEEVDNYDGINDDIYIIATGMKGNSPIYDDRYAYVTYNDKPYIVDLQSSSILDEDSDKYKEIYKIENPERTGEQSTDSSTNNDDIDQMASLMGLNDDNLFRLVDQKKHVFDKQKETEWLQRTLPNLAGDDRLAFFDGLIPVMGLGRQAWGKFDGSMMTISSVAARGTVYHEAFHAVFHMLLDSDKRASILNKAKEYYGRDLDNEELEEMLADDFMNYTIREESILGKISNWFRNLSIKRDNWKSARIHLNNLFRDINNGVYSNIEPQSVTLSRELAKQEEYTQEMKDILANAPRDEDGRLLAPNGQPSNLIERQYAQVRTKAFKKWFGDWEKAYKEQKRLRDFKKQAFFTYKNEDGETIRATAQKMDNGDYRIIFKHEDGGSWEYIAKGEFVKQKGLDGVISYLNDDADVQRSTPEEYLGKSLDSFIKTNVSKVVDENGEPKVMYHGTPWGEFSEFRHFMPQTGDRTPSGRFYFTTNKFAASRYERGDFNKGNNNPKTYPVFLNIRNPFNSQDQNSLSKEYIDGVINKLAPFLTTDEYNGIKSSIEESYNLDTKYSGKFIGSYLYQAIADYFADSENYSRFNEVTSEMIRQGMNDGMFYLYGQPFTEKKNQVWAINPNQIKSAIDNIGTFDSNNPDIRFRLADENEQYKKYLDIYQRNSAIKSYPTRAQAIQAYNNLKKRYPKARIMFKEGGRISEQLNPTEGKFHVYMNKPQLIDFTTPQQFSLVDDGLDYYRNLNQEQALSEAALITQEEREQFISDGHSDAFVDLANKDKTILDILRTCSGIDI